MNSFWMGEIISSSLLSNTKSSNFSLGPNKSSDGTVDCQVKLVFPHNWLLKTISVMHSRDFSHELVASCID